MSNQPANGTNGALLAQPGPGLAGELRVPGDKSITHRAFMLAGLARGTSAVSGFLDGEDCRATLRCMEALGARAHRAGPSLLQISGVGAQGLSPSAEPLDCGNSGTTMRLLAGVLAGQDFSSVLIGDDSLQSRPMQRIAEPLERMGATVGTQDGHAPLHIRGGGLVGIDYALPVASAQVKSALLLAGLYAAGWTRVTGGALTRDHTERLLPAFGARVHKDGDAILIEPCGVLEACDIEVPADISSAAFFIVAACLSPGSDLQLRGVGVNPTRTGLLQALRQMGARIDVSNERSVGEEPVADLRVHGGELRGIEMPAELAPTMIDEYPALFVAAAAAKGTTVIRDVADLRNKESDRIATMVAGLRSLGIEVEEFPDGAIIQGGTICGGVVDSAGDHRVAMAFAVAGHCARETVRVESTDNIATSFPGFVALARRAGMQLEPAT